jgi:ethanolamine utilization cobalamin adenosyltransferase
VPTVSKLTVDQDVLAVISSPTQNNYSANYKNQIADISFEFEFFNNAVVSKGFYSTIAELATNTATISGTRQVSNNSKNYFGVTTLNTTTFTLDTLTNWQGRNWGIRNGSTFTIEEYR